MDVTIQHTWICDEHELVDYCQSPPHSCDLNLPICNQSASWKIAYRNHCLLPNLPTGMKHYYYFLLHILLWRLFTDTLHVPDTLVMCIVWTVWGLYTKFAESSFIQEIIWCGRYSGLLSHHILDLIFIPQISPARFQILLKE